MPVLSLEEITKRFPGVTALDGVSLELEAGGVHALAGENGAGKSTLINILSGVLRPDAGRILWEGKPLAIDSPRRARQLGIAVVHQEAAMFSDLSVAENIALPAGLPTRAGGWVRWRAIREAARSHLAAVGADDLAPSRLAGTLSAGQRQLVAIATAISQRPRVLLLDEPTASLTAEETRRLHDAIRRLAAGGTAVLYISHRLEEVFEIADRITVLRDGRHVLTRPLAELDHDAVVAAMVGRDVSYEAATEHAPSGPALEVESYTDPAGRFRDVSFAVRRGEIVGLYGMVGSGRSELAQSLLGLRPPGRGTLRLGGRATRLTRPSQARRERLCYVPEDRLTQGIFATRSVRDNICVASWRELSRGGFSRPRAERALANQTVNRLRIALADIEQPVQSLSGGNQQKAVLGRWLATEPEVLVLDEPTRGIDVGAKAEIHRIIDSLARQGAAILLISSELPEVVAMSDRALVMREGRLVGDLAGGALTEEDMARTALGGGSGKRETGASRGGAWWLTALRTAGLLAVLAAIVAFLSLRASGFATASNFSKILTDISLVAIAAIGMTVVIIGGGLDISVGSILALASACSVLAVKGGSSVATGIAIAVGLAVALGALNGAVSALTRVHPIVVTLGAMSVYQWLFLTVLGGQWIREVPAGVRQLALAECLGVQGIVWFALAVVVAGIVLLRCHALGRQLYARGGNEHLAATIGIRTRSLSVLSFAIGGATVGLAAILWAAEYNTIQSNLGEGFALQVIAAAVIGGANIMGGSGSAFGTAIAALLIGVIYNGMVMLGIHSDWQKAVFGVLIVAAVLLDKLLRHLAEE